MKIFGYRDRGALNRTLYYIKDTYKHNCHNTKNLSEITSVPILAWIALWFVFLILVIVYVLHIVPDLLTGYKLWVPEVKYRDMKSNEITELLRKEKRKSEQRRMPVYSPRSKEDIMYKSKNNSTIYDDSPLENESTPEESQSITKATAFLMIKNIILANRGTLRGVIKNTIKRKISNDEMIQFNSIGYLKEAAFKQYISFGPQINEMINMVVGVLPTCIYTKKKGETYFVLNNGDYTPITDKLQEIYNINEIKISLTEG